LRISRIERLDQEGHLPINSRNVPETSNRARSLSFLVLSALVLFSSILRAEDKSTEVRPLALGATAPDFKLRSVDSKEHELSDFAAARVLVIIFTCNHCPTA
jgi:hypothetical protein